MHQHIPFYKNGEHIMFTMGDDFHYQNARMNFKNMDKAGNTFIPSHHCLVFTGLALIPRSISVCFRHALSTGNQTHNLGVLYTLYTSPPGFKPRPPYLQSLKAERPLSKNYTCIYRDSVMRILF